MNARTMALAVACCMLAPAAAHAQRGAGAAAARGPGWLGRQSYFDAPSSDRLTPAEQAVMLARLLEIERILLRVPELAQPRGFEVEPRLGPGNRVNGPATVIGSHYWLMFYNPTRAIAGEGCSCISVLVNSVLGGLKSPYSDERGEMYFEVEPGPSIPGATHVWENLSATDPGEVTVMLTTGGRSPWKPVTRENFLKAVIAQAEGKKGEKLGELREALSRTPYEQWLAEAPERARQREGTLAALAGVERAELRKVLEATERETGELLKAADASDRAENARNLGALTGHGDRFRARLSAMSPTERNLPAWLDRMDTSGDFPFLAPGAPNSMRVLQVDFDAYRPVRSRVEARTIAVKIKTTGTGNTPEVQPALYAAYQNLDWAALARLLEPPPK